MVYDAIVAECGLSTLIPGVSSPQLKDLYLAFQAVFDRDKQSDASGAGGRSGVIDLLRVLLAAQEPLSLAVLQQMGLAKHLKVNEHA